jgi:flagellar protein FlaG
MDGIANVARQQQSQVSTSETYGRAAQQVQQSVQQPQKVDVIKEIRQEGIKNAQGQERINSKAQVEALVDDLNKAMAPMNTNIKFGVDSQDIFYVSVIDSETNKMLRRFPVEQAQNILPKMQEVTGVLFDTKG